MNLTDPGQSPDPTLDPVRRAAILDQVLTSTSPARRRSPWLPALAAAAAVVAVAGGGYALSVRDDDRPAPAAKAPAPTRATEPAVPFTLGPLAAPARSRQAEACNRQTPDPEATVTVPYAQRVRTPYGTRAAVVVEQAATASAFFCSEDGTFSTLTARDMRPIEPPTLTRPVTVVDGGGTSASTRKRTITTLFHEILLRVHPVVARVEIRVGTAARPGTWHRSTPQGGYVYAGAWLEGDVPESTPLFVEIRAYDAAGALLRAPGLGRERLRLYLRHSGTMMPGAG
ncbi:hypothetical protein G5V59_24800 [Nocardioides sp. W3-2-3]|nr:hypothetical protein [Nocardioides convexus]